MDSTTQTATRPETDPAPLQPGDAPAAAAVAPESAAAAPGFLTLDTGPGMDVGHLADGSI